MIASKLYILAIPVPVVVAAFIWPFTATETVLLMTTAGGLVMSIISASKANAAKLAVNGHLAKQEKEQEKSKTDRDAEFERLLQVVRDASRAEGEEIARKAAELLAIKVAEGVALERAEGKVLVPVSVAPAMSAAAPAAIAAQPVPAQAGPAVAPAKRIDAAIEELTDAAEATSVAADTTTDLAKKHPR